MDITIKNVSPDMAKAIELLASKADVACGPKIEVEVHEDAPKKYEPLGELKLIRLTHEKYLAICQDTLILAKGYGPTPDADNKLHRLFFEHQSGMRYRDWIKKWIPRFIALYPLDMKAMSGLHKIDADLDAGPQE